MKTTGTNPNITILFEDNHLLAIHKPAGVLSQEDYSGEPDVLTLCKAYLKNEYNKPGNVFLGLVHRLDRPVAGVMLLAKTSKAASRISEQIRKRSVQKRYLAVVEGHPDDNGMLMHYLLKNSNTNRVSVVGSGISEAQKAELTYQKAGQKDNLALLNVKLITGRPHQIRVQLAHEGFPIIGDRKYGNSSNCDIALFASELEVVHPTLKKPQTFSATPSNIYPWSLFTLNSVP
jgi:23S rRNA pseudouridine1911/1915/1917 synthase